MLNADDWIEDSALKNISYGFDWRVVKSMTSEKMSCLAQSLAPKKTGVDLIRIGGQADGGYIIPDDLDGILGCFSPGVGSTATFEKEMLARGIPCYLADASVDKAPIEDENLVFDPVFIGPKTQGNFITLEDWVQKYAPPEGDLVLQMDIEGAEYDILTHAPRETLSRFRVLTVEFHRFHLCLNARHYKRIADALHRLSDLFVPVHVHANNARPFVRYGDYVVPRTIEISYLRRDRITKDLSPVSNMPHPLDEANVPSHPNPPLPEWMWQQG
ncbi:FkbM family methyltransferase [Arenibacterium sp. CAU 1754]